MLDPYTYRVSERLAKSSLPAWQIAQTHNLDHFEKSGFPVRIESVQDLGPLIDTMQENRFDKYMRELGGLTLHEYELVLDASCRAVSFQLKFLPSRRPVVPASTLMSVFCLYKKLMGVNPSFRSVLEIGPGCGYLSFFLQQHNALENYSQIEACESFYILQNLVNVHCFGERFAEKAFLPLDSQLSDYFVTPNAVTEFAPLARVPRDSPTCTHYPWWRIGELISRDVKFEIVTSNANLLEFNPKALDDYLELIHRVLKPDGVLIAQCLGYPSQGSYQSLLEKLWNRGFALLSNRIC
jgi:SAM-dependent methyltransferase